MRERNYQLEVLRVISCINVILIHVCNVYCRSFDVIGKGEFAFSAFFSCMARTSVPIFFMISGATSLGSRYDIKKYAKKVINIGVTLALATLFYYVWDTCVLGRTYNFKEIFYTPVKGHLWYLYAYLGILIMLPFLQKMFADLDKKWELLFLGIWLAYFVFYQITSWIGMEIKYPIPILGSSYYVGYYVLGYVLNKYLKEIRIKDKWLYLMRFSSLAIIVVLTCILSFTKNRYYIGFTHYYTIFMVMQSASMFVLIGRKEPKKWLFMEKDIIAEISKISFTIYLIHPVFLDLLKEVLPFTEHSAFWVIPVALCLVFTASVVTAILYETIKGKFNQRKA